MYIRIELIFIIIKCYQLRIYAFFQLHIIHFFWKMDCVVKGFGEVIHAQKKRKSKRRSTNSRQYAVFSFILFKVDFFLFLISSKRRVEEK